MRIESELLVGRPARRADRAFTLLELLIVLGLLVLLAGISWPVLQNQITAAELPESADRIRDMIYLARTEAAMQHRRVRIRFEPQEQQPIIEYERDPVEYPNEWEEINASWWTKEMRGRLLLGDVQVHEIRLGRPPYLRPLGLEEDPRQLLEQAELEQEQVKDLDDPSVVTAFEQSNAEIDENRPWIYLEPDGSVEWATLVMAKLPLAESLEEDHRQIWVVIDGRTGLASVQEKITEEKLLDPEFYIPKEKLELPDQVEIDSLAFKIGGPEEFGAGGSGDLFGGLSSEEADGQGDVPMDELPGDMPDDQGLDDGGSPDQPGRPGGFGGSGRGGQDMGERGGGGRRGPGRRGGGPGQGNRATSEQGAANPDDSMSELDDLERELEGSNLTDEERRNIRRTLRNNRRN